MRIVRSATERSLRKVSVKKRKRSRVMQAELFSALHGDQKPSVNIGFDRLYIGEVDQT